MPRKMKPATRVKSERHAELGRQAAARATRDATGKFVAALPTPPPPDPTPPAPPADPPAPPPVTQPATRPKSWNPLR